MNLKRKIQSGDSACLSNAGFQSGTSAQPVGQPLRPRRPILLIT